MPVTFDKLLGKPLLHSHGFGSDGFTISDGDETWRVTINSSGVLVTEQITQNVFNPNSITGLVLWLKADAITGLSNNDSLTTWEDSSSSNNDVTEATNKPLYKTGGLNSRPYVYFDGTNDLLTKASPTGLPSGANARTVFIVAQDRGIANYHPMYAYGDASSNATFSLAFHSTTQLLSWGYSNDDLITATLANNTGYYFMHQYTGTNIVVRQNGAGIYNAADTIDTGSTALKIGNYINNAYPSPVNIYEVLIYDTALSAGNITSIESYLATKYDL